MFRCLIASLMLLAAVDEVPADLVLLQVNMDGAQQVPPVTTTAAGAGNASLDTMTGELTWNISFGGLSSAQTAAHWHGAATYCESGPPLVTLPLGSPRAGSTTLTADQVDDVIAGRWYLNVHSADHPAGELRGQLVPRPLAEQLPEPITASSIHVHLEPVVAGLTAPVGGASAPGIVDRIFVVEQSGAILSVDLDSGAIHEVLDTSDIMVTLGAFGPESFDERGLLGLAFHPDYQSNARLYTYTSEPNGPEPDFTTMPGGETANHQTVIREWCVLDPATPDPIVDPRSSRVLLRIDQPQFNHNAGALMFGPDDLLYIALGDGGGSDDTDGQFHTGHPMVGHGCQGNGQDVTNPLGSILRIDPDGSDSANGAYGIPADNPFVGAAGVDEIFAYGLRNPWRASFDIETGELWVGDVGQKKIEEVNVVTLGGNYGWRLREGTFWFVHNGVLAGYVTDRPQAGPADPIDPVAQYDHDEGIAIIGGYVYRGSRLPGLEGRYVFGDVAVTFDNDGRLFHLDESQTIREFGLVGIETLELFVLGFGQDSNGELYVMGNGTGTPFGRTGVVYRMTNGPGDADADGDVDIDDLLAVVGTWGPCAGCPTDFDGDGEIDIDDLLVVLGLFR